VTCFASHLRPKDLAAFADMGTETVLARKPVYSIKHGHGRQSVEETKGDYMSKKEQGQKPAGQAPAGGNVASIVIDRCKVDGCKAKSAKAGFCEEHFVWFKEGLVTVDGHNAKDFEKKYQHFMKNKKKVA
jgi:hypothetical protein